MERPRVMNMEVVKVDYDLFLMMMIDDDDDDDGKEMARYDMYMCNLHRT
jgi:hypothetical protein